MSANQSPPKTNGWVESATNAANTAGGHVANAAIATRDYLAGAANTTTNTAQQKKEETSGFLANTAQTAKENVANAAQATRDYVAGAANTTTNTAQQKKEETSEYLTGTNVMNTAHGAVETVKNAMGMNEKK
ncbi:hypothetical protein MKW94_004286 [Papaver nudicaule]|uniref:Uncharacterized protein n=1 Tax=Papaver nudicaule TaxID=74823 RepID=A0AA41RTI2_PAPNU|nr:hypothetical protein [Papaver nudicaule]